MNKLKNTFFVVIGILALGITSTVLSNPKSRFWEPQSQASSTAVPTKVLCDQYKKYPDGTCSNTTCPSGRYCSQNPVSGSTTSDGKLCQQNRTDGDNVVDCCPAGMILNTGKTACIVPTATPTAAPTKVFCDQYKKYPDGTCSNTTCPSGRYCSQNPVSGSATSDGKLCQQNRTDGDNIVDCCPAGKVLNTARNACVTPTASPTPAPTKVFCDQYKKYPDGTCSNTTCPSDRYCSQNTVTGSNNGDGKLCQQNRTDGDNIVDCCPAGSVLNTARTACVAPSTATVPTATPTPQDLQPTDTAQAPETVTVITASSDIALLFYRLVVIVFAQ